MILYPGKHFLVLVYIEVWSDEWNSPGPSALPCGTPSFASLSVLIYVMCFINYTTFIIGIKMRLFKFLDAPNLNRYPLVHYLNSL